MLHNIIVLSLLIAVVIILRAVFKKKVSAKLIYALWIAVVIKLCIPVSFLNVLPQIDLYPDKSAEISVATPAADEMPSSEVTYVQPETPVTEPVDHQTAPVDLVPDVTPITYDVTAPDVTVDPVIEPEPAPTRSFDLTRALYIAWGVCSAAAALFFIVNGVVFYTKLRRTREYVGKMHKVNVYSSSATETPCVFGLVPSIYLTPDVRNSSAYSLALSHEWAHIRQGDNVWAIVRILALIIYPWNPLVWAAAILSKRDSEFACDEAVTEKLDRDDRLNYAQMLVDSVNVKPRGVVGLGSAPLNERIKAVTEKRKTSVIALILALTLTLTAFGCSFIGTEETEKTPDETEVSDDLPEETKTVLLNTVTTSTEPYGTHKYVAEYDEYGRLIKSTAYTDGEEYSVTEYTYDEYGYQNSEKFVTDELSYIYEWTNNADGNRLKGTEKTEQANGLSSFESEFEYKYDKKGRVESYDCTTVSKKAMTSGKTITEQHRTYEYTDEYGSYTMKEWGDNIPETLHLCQFDENGNIDEEIVCTDGYETLRTKYDRHGYAMKVRRKVQSGMEITRFENTYENGLLTKMVKNNEDGKTISTTVITYDGNGNPLSTVITAEDGTETYNTVYEYEEFEVKVFGNGNSSAEEAEDDKSLETEGTVTVTSLDELTLYADAKLFDQAQYDFYYNLLIDNGKYDVLNTVKISDYSITFHPVAGKKVPGFESVFKCKVTESEYDSLPVGEYEKVLRNDVYSPCFINDYKQWREDLSKEDGLIDKIVTYLINCFCWDTYDYGEKVDYPWFANFICAYYGSDYPIPEYPDGIPFDEFCRMAEEYFGCSDIDVLKSYRGYHSSSNTVTWAGDGTSIIFDYIGTIQEEDSQLVVLQYYADMTKVVKSHKVGYRFSKDGNKWLGCEVLEKGEEEPIYRHSLRGTSATTTNAQHVRDTSYPFLEMNQFMDTFVRFFHDEYSKDEELKGNALYAMSLLCINAAQQEKPTFSIVQNDKEHYVEIKKSDIDYVTGMILGKDVDLTKYHGTLGKKPEETDPRFNYLIDEYLSGENVYHFIIGRDYWNDDPCAIDHDTVVIEEDSSKLVYTARINIYEEQFSDVIAESKDLTYTFEKVCDNELMYLRLVSIKEN